MGTAITWLIAFSVVIASLFTAVTGVISTGSLRAESVAVSDQRLIEELETSMKFVSVKTRDKNKEIELVLTNDGRTSLGEFEDWILTVRYDQDKAAGETYVVPFYSDSLVDNSWVTHSFWLDYDASQGELIDPGRLNVHEEMVIRIKLNPKMEKNTLVVVTITTPAGFTETIIFES